MLINQIGLISDVIGAVLLFVYGLPSKYTDNPDGYRLVINKRPKEEIELEKKINRMVYIRAHIGITLLLMGFIFQLIATFIK